MALVDKVTALAKAGDSVAAVQSVNGSTVDNTDPLNPLVNAVGPTPTDTAYGFVGDTPAPVINSTSTLRLTWSTDTVNPPGTAQASADSDDFSLITKLRLSKTTGTTPAGDISFIVSRFKQENVLYISVDQKPNSFVGFVIDGNPTDEGSYYEIPVTGATVGNSALDGELLLFATNATDMQSGLGYVFTSWGANLQNAGRYPAINGTSSSSEISGLGIDASAQIPADGTIDVLTYYNATGDNTTVFKIILNGAVAHTFTCDAPYGRETGIGVSVAVGDNVALRYDSGMKPSSGIYSMYIS